MGPTSARVDTNLMNLQRLENEIAVLNTSSDVGKHFGRIKSILEKKGEIIEDADILIASIVMDNGAILVTNNQRHFGRIEGLRTENWV